MLKLRQVIKLKNIKYLLVISLCFLLTGCSKDFIGTWCLYTETPSSLVVLDKDISESDLNKLKEYIENNIKDLKTYDVIDKIEESNQMITIYYTKSDNISAYQEEMSSLSGIDNIIEKELNTSVEKLDITKKDYTYGTQLDTIYAANTNGKYEIKNNIITLDNDTKFYYKDSYLCYDEACSRFLTKSKSGSCDNS